MKKILLILMTIIVFPLFLNADNLNFPVNCPGGGTLLITGDYNPLNGATNVNLALNSCVINDGSGTKSISGNATLTGTLVVNGAINLNLNIQSINYVENSQDGSINQTCSGTITFVGSNDSVNTNLQQTTSSITCSGSGSFNFNQFINSLIFLNVF